MVTDSPAKGPSVLFRGSDEVWHRVNAAMSSWTEADYTASRGFEFVAESHIAGLDVETVWQREDGGLGFAEFTVSRFTQGAASGRRELDQMRYASTFAGVLVEHEELAAPILGVLDARDAIRAPALSAGAL